MSVRWDKVDRSRFWGERPVAAPLATSTQQRWDSVVDKSRYQTQTAPRAASPVATQQSSGVEVPVKIWLYGTLAALLPERPLELKLTDGFTLGTVFDELGRRCGEAFLGKVLMPDGSKSNQCRAFVDGMPVDDIDTPVHVGSKPALVELILITAIEGG